MIHMSVLGKRQSIFHVQGIVIFFNVYLFIVRDRACAHTSSCVPLSQRGAERHRERESQAGLGGLRAVSAEPDFGFHRTNPEIMT